MLLAQSLACWALVLGLWEPAAAFAVLPAITRNAVVVLAVLSPVAAIGTWFVSDWGPVLWAAAVTALGIALALGTPLHGAATLAFAGHAVLFAAWLLLAIRVERRGSDAPGPRAR